MKTPVDTPKEIIAEALADAHDIDMTDDLYAEAILRKLEAAGYVIVDPDNVTEEMVRAFIVGQTLNKPWEQNVKDQISAALRAAPQWSKGSEG